MKETEIRPQQLFKKFLKLAEKDAGIYFKKKYFISNCIACGKKSRFSFKKKGFSYFKCNTCNTLYHNPRADESSFNDYYTKSRSSKFWSKIFYKKTEKSRRIKMWKPKAKMIFDLLNKYKIKNYNCVDIGGGYGLFAEEFFKLSGIKTHVIEPSQYSAEACRKKGIQVIEKFLKDVEKKDLPTRRKVFTSFELIEHLHNPKNFFQSLKKLMSKNDLFIFTTLSGTGVDILTLWEQSEAISPPFHINFFNPNSIRIILEKNNFKVLNISTPGKIDIDILSNRKKLIKDRFWYFFLNHSSEFQQNEMQKIISSLNLSSHMMVVAKKK
jgi:2-polyprenyl-3-methyl-5-hydroxy-6-metoxy-1,4-benzoquinol methylase